MRWGMRRAAELRRELLLRRAHVFRARVVRGREGVQLSGNVAACAIKHIVNLSPRVISFSSRNQSTRYSTLSHRKQSDKTRVSKNVV